VCVLCVIQIDVKSIESRVSNTYGNPGNLLELFFLLEIFWKFAKSPGNILAEFVCLLLL